MEEKSLKNAKDDSQKESVGRPEGLRTWIDISTAAIDHNIQIARKLLPEKTKIMAVVKSNAYGHGLFEYSSYILSHGASWLGVDSVVEAIALRKHGIKAPILIMGYTLPERLMEAVRADVSVTISSTQALTDAVKVMDNAGGFFRKQILKAHIKIDTGLHRQGFMPAEVPALIEKLSALKKKISVEGLYSHFSDAKREQGIEYSKKQRDIFNSVRDQFHKAGFSPLIHMDASPSLMRFGSEGDDMVRLGAFLYGIWPSPGMETEFGKKFDLKPALLWETLITEIKRLPQGATIGYNQSETLVRNSVIAVCPIGYWHGYPSSLSSKGIVVVNGRLAKVLGRVTMDMMVIDCTDIPGVSPLDIVTLISDERGSPVNAQAVAALAGISVHELLTRLNTRIKKIYK